MGTSSSRILKPGAFLINTFQKLHRLPASRHSRAAQYSSGTKWHFKMTLFDVEDVETDIADSMEADGLQYVNITLLLLGIIHTAHKLVYIAQ